MNPGESTRARLQTLQMQGSLAKSACSRSLLDRLAPLISTGVIAEERSGAGRRLVVRQPGALAAFIDREFPGADVAADDLSRTLGVAQYRDSKAHASDTPEIVSVRAWSGEALLLRGQPCGVAEATAAHGVFAFLLGSESRHSISSLAALVENPALFAHFERLHLPVPLAIYGHGRTSSRLVDWLVSQTAPGFKLLHMPDYDPTGLTEYVRLHSRLGSRISLHLPGGLEEGFRKFSNRAMLSKPHNRAMLAGLQNSPLPEVRRVVALINEHNAGLEQEALLLERPGE